MKVVTQYSQVKDFNDEKTGLDWEEGPIWKLSVCPACSGLNIIRISYHSCFEPDNWVFEVIYPNDSEKKLEGLPPQIDNEYKAALKVKNISSNAYATLLGRVIDKVCLDRGAEGDTLYTRVEALANNEEIPKRLVDMLHQLRLLRNIGAHADIGELTDEEIPILDSLCAAILEYIYIAPKLINQAEKHILRLKEKNNKYYRY